MVKNQMGRKVKILRFDNGDEYTSKELKYFASKGIKYYKLDLCKFCIMRTQHRVAFSTSKHQTKSLLDLIHTDVWGPSPVASIEGTRYYVTFIDDFSKTLGILLEAKIRSISKVQGVKNYGEKSDGAEGESLEV